ncbi:MAG: transposase [Acetobacteraceae bacterium]
MRCGLGRWLSSRVLLRADSGFAGETPMAWCKANRVDYEFGLARNERLEAAIEAELGAAARASCKISMAACHFSDANL